MKIKIIDGDREGPITSIIRRRVRIGYEEKFERWSKNIANACCNFKGYLGTRVIRPADKSGTHVTIISFNNFLNYQAWLESEMRKDWIRKVECFTDGSESMEQLTGFDYWRAEGVDNGRTWPPSYKMIVAAYIAITPLVYYVSPLMKPFLPAHPIVSSLLSSLVITILMGYISLPLVTLVLRKWVVSSRN